MAKQAGTRTCRGCGGTSARGKEGPAGTEYANKWFCENCWRSWEGEFVPEPDAQLLGKGSQDKCARQGCPYLRHSTLGIGHCCRACAGSGEHGPACERRPCGAGSHGTTASTPTSRVAAGAAVNTAPAAKAAATPKAAAASAAGARIAPAGAARFGAGGKDSSQVGGKRDVAQVLVEEYSVVVSQVFVRAAPALNAEKVGKLPQGALVVGQAAGGWLRLDATSGEKAQVPAGQAAFVLIDGSQFSLGKLLEFRRARPPCGAFSRDVYTNTLEYTALRPLTVWERPSEDSRKLGVLDSGKPAVGYPMGDWFELKDNWGWVPIVREGNVVLEPSVQVFRAFVQRKFAEGLLFGWSPIPANNVSYDVEWAAPSDLNAEWDGVSEDEVTRELGVRHADAHIRSLAPLTRVIFRVFARVLVESSEPDKDSPLVGTWAYGSKPTKYRVIKLDGGRLKFDGPHSGAGRVSGALEPAGPYLQADVCDPQGERIGTIRLRYREEDNTITSNWKNANQDDWGKDIVARKSATERVLTTMESNWLEEYTGFPISDKEEQECRYDPLSNLRGGCQRCSCPGFIVQTSLEVSSLEQCACRRCGCPCTKHTLIEEYLAKEQPSTFKITTRTWSVEDLKPGEDPVSFAIAQIEAAENLYETLGVPHTAAAQEVRRAFRSISLRLHPDKLVGRATEEPELAEKAEIFFKLLSAASEVLGDERRRRDYDAQWKRELQKSHKLELREQKVQQERERREQMARRYREMGSQGEEEDPDFGLGGDLGRDLFRKGGVFGQSGLYKEHAGGGFTWQFAGGGTITVDHTQNFPNRAHMSEKMPWEWTAQGKELYANSGMSSGYPASGPPSPFGPGLQSASAARQASAFDAPYRRFDK